MEDTQLRASGAKKTNPSLMSGRHLGQPRVFDYFEYRKFLADWFQWKKSVSTHYSGAVFAKKAGLASHTLLGMIIRGERNLSHASIRAFCRALGLKSKEQLYFEKIVLFSQAKTSEDKSYYFEQVHSLSHGAGRELLTKLHDYADVLSHWYIVAIRELAVLPDFKEDPDWIAQKLKKKISKKEATKALQILFRVGLLQKNEKTGKIETHCDSIDIDPGTVDFAIQNFHKEYLDRSKEAIDSEPIEERDLSSITLAVSKEDLELIKKKVKEFRKQINLEFPVSKSPMAHVVALNMQVLTLTRGEREDE